MTRLASNLVVKLKPHLANRLVSEKLSGKFSGMPCLDMNRNMGSSPRPKSLCWIMDLKISSTLAVWFLVVRYPTYRRNSETSCGCDKTVSISSTICGLKKIFCYFPSNALISVTDEAAMIFSYHLMPRRWELNPRHVESSRIAPDLRRMFYRLSCSYIDRRHCL